ncbi:MAG: hypothetical protein KAQ78_10215 [Candidatus Latescibacteria bacterium]|nr:hypothetical protein [Candidatus Latescibacterota bacterium]
MEQLAQGKVQNGSIVFPQPLPFPEGMEVLVRIDPITTGTRTATFRETRTPDASMHFADLPFFGMWADREDMREPSTWVRKEREQWQRRSMRQD